jgi:purine-binding chemotaxis protein CheW
MRLVSETGIKEINKKLENTESSSNEPKKNSANKIKTPLQKENPLRDSIPKEETDPLDNLGKDKKGELQLVLFKLGKEEYGVEIHEVERIIKMQGITRVPHSPSFVEGILNLRGKIVVVINLLKRFGTFNQEEHKGSHIIISNVEGNSFGVMVDGVQEVKTISKKDTRKAPGIISQKIRAEYLKGIGILNKGERLLILIDLEKILGEKEMLEMAKLTEGMEEKAKQQEVERKAEAASKTPKITDEQIESKFEKHFSQTSQKLSKIRHKHKLKKLKPGLRKISKPSIKPQMNEKKFEDNKKIEKELEERAEKEIAKVEENEIQREPKKIPKQDNIQG